MDLVTFELGITTGAATGKLKRKLMGKLKRKAGATCLGGKGWQREAIGLVTFGLGITIGTAQRKLKGKLTGTVGGNGTLCTSDNFESGNQYPNS